MASFKMLILTDHRNHSPENSLYVLAREMYQHPDCVKIDVATRGLERNKYFFEKHIVKNVVAHAVDEQFIYRPNGAAFNNNQQLVSISDYEVVWLRLPPPLSVSFVHFLKNTFPDQLFINDPAGIYQTGSKAFLTRFPNLCAPMKICHSIDDIIAFKSQFPIVLKPFREYGGRGIVKIDGEKVWMGKDETTFDRFTQSLPSGQLSYLGVQYLKNVNQGDKRIIVVGEQIMGASLRLPAANSWLCNVSMGGHAVSTEVAPEEVAMVEQLTPKLSEMGIVMYGLDTLVGDDGQRVLSEINTTSIGGLPQMAVFEGKPLVKEAIHRIAGYIN